MLIIIIERTCLICYKENFSDLDITILTLFRVLRENDILLKIKRHLYELVKRFGKIFIKKLI